MSKKPKDRKEKKRRDAKRARQQAAAAGGGAPDPKRAKHAVELFERARQMYAQGRTEDAVAGYKKVLRYNPVLVPALVNLGVSLQGLERMEEAIVYLRKALALDPAFAEAHNNLGTCLQARGELEEAAVEFARAVELRPDLGPAWVNLGTIKRYTDPDDSDIAAMEAELARLGFNDPRSTQFRFALGKAYEDLGDYDRSFEHMDRANRLHRSKIHYGLESGNELFRSIAREHDAEFLAVPPHQSCSDAAPIFIVGYPRSGSTLVEQILASHSLACAVGEVPDLDNTARVHCETRDKRDFPEKIRAASPEQLAQMGAEYLRRIQARSPSAPRVIDKSLNNFMHVGFLQRALPNARVIHCRREPIDTCLACYRMHFSSPVHYAYDMVDLGGRYAAYDELMQHWHAHLPGRVLDVQYEDMVADQEAQSRRLLEFCGLEWEDACLTFHRTQRTVTSASVSQVRKPIYSTSVARWKRYEKHLGPLIEALGPCAPKDAVRGAPSPPAG